MAYGRRHNYTYIVRVTESYISIKLQCFKSANLIKIKRLKNKKKKLFLFSIISSHDWLAAPSNVIVNIYNINFVGSGRVRRITVEECQFDTHHDDDYYSEHVARRYIINIII